MSIRALLSVGTVVCLLAGCTTDDKPLETAPGEVGTTDDTATDADGDGVPAADDCDDGNATVFPGAEEVCDGVDNDCDGVVDPETATGARSFSADRDGDGFGDPADTVTACEAPADTVTNALDCDDGDAAVHPDADEVCDGVDNDCDALLDDADDSLDVSTGATFYGDVDADGFGDPDFSLFACAQPEGFVEDATDCDDATADVNPDADEVCDDVDNDCDGLVDDADDSIDLSTIRTFFRDGDGDGYGVVDDITEGCSLPSGYSTEPTDCDDDNPAISPGATEVCDAGDVDEDCDGLSDDLDPSADRTTGTVFYTDSDGDGFGDSTDTGTAFCDDPSDGTLVVVTNASDCDDTDAAVSPVATEVCDVADVDEDCSGAADDLDPGVDPTTQTDWFVDGDGDSFGDGSALAACDDPSDGTTSYVTTDGDCADADSAIYPGATEVCDDQDNDCDGDIDDDDADLDTSTATEWFVDGDGDGYGDSDGSATVACDAPTDTIDNSTDCDDSDATINPAATEVCDASDVDEDCNGVADDADSGVDTSGFTDWYTDADSDGFGDSAATATAQCNAPSGSVADNTDCDDSTAAVNPDAQEVCDSLDNDCDGDTDDADSSLDVSTTTSWAPDSDGDGYGDDSATTDACTAPSGTTDTLGDCDDADAAVNPAAAEVCDSIDNDCDGDTDDDDDDVDVSVGGTTYYADTDTDGYGDENDAGTGFCDDPGTGWSDVDTDCDDAAAAVNPGATEVCNLVDDDCDPSTSSDGMALWVDSAGATTDLTAVLSAGTSGSPIAFPSPGDGTAYVCTGTWYAYLTVDGDDVDLVGVDGSASVIVDAGGADQVLEVKRSATVDITGFTLQDGDKSKGGALSVDSSTLTGSDLILQDSAADEGGGLYVDKSTVTLSDCLIDDNVSADVGGGIFIEDTSDVDLTTCIVSNNSSDFGGGVYLTDSSTLSAELSTFSSNEALDGNGGGIRCYSSDSVSLVDTDFTSNTASDNGGSIAMLDCTLTMDGGTISSSSAAYAGALITYDSATLTDVDVDNNTSDEWSGAVYAELGDDETFAVSGGSFTNNTGDSYGGGLYLYLTHRDALASFVSTTFSGNSPYDVDYEYWNGGAIYLYSPYTYSTTTSVTCEGPSGCN